MVQNLSYLTEFHWRSLLYCYARAEDLITYFPTFLQNGVLQNIHLETVKRHVSRLYFIVWISQILAYGSKSGSELQWGLKTWCFFLFLNASILVSFLPILPPLLILFICNLVLNDSIHSSSVLTGQQFCKVGCTAL